MTTGGTTGGTVEVSVELVESGLVESLQDCGAAGLASSLSEMARDCGIDLRLDQVPLREDGMEPREAIFQACLLRFRPILMTTLAALFAAVPLILGTGVGSELRQPLGICIAGGLIVSQVLTLFTTPVIYLAFDRLERRIAGRRGLEGGEVLP